MVKFERKYETSEIEEIVDSRVERARVDFISFRKGGYARNDRDV